VDHFKKALAFAEDRDDIYFNIGLTYQSWGKFSSAIKYYKKCIELNVENEAAMQEIIYCMEITGSMREELPFFQAFIDKDPYSYVAWFNLGNVYNKMGSYDKAIAAYDYSTLIKPDFITAYNNMANAYVFIGEYTKAIEAFNGMLEHGSPSAEVFCNIGECYEKMQQWDLSRRYYQKSIDLDPEMDEAWFGIGVVLDAQGKWYEAVHFFKKAVNLYDDSVDYWVALASAEYHVGHVVSALESYARAAEIQPED